MACLIDTGEGEVAVLTDLAADVGAVGDDGSVAGGVEGFGVGVGYGEGEGFGAEPVLSDR